MEDIKYVGIVPLIGGMMIGAEKALKKRAEYMLSYPAFAGNDQYIKDHWKGTPFHLIEPVSNTIDVDLPQVDFVSALCPCAGLSQLNSAKTRGADAPQNDWMYKSTEFVLENMQPKVLWGENASGLYGSVGAPVSQLIREIGEQHGYSFSMIRTDSILHGIPQRRPRAFYFLWKSETAPILNWKKKQPVTLEEHLSMVKDVEDVNDLKEKTLSFQVDPFYLFLKNEYGNNWREVVLKHKKSLIDVILKEKKSDEFIDFLKTSGNDSLVNAVLHAKKKRDEGKNFWFRSSFLPGDSTGALNGSSMQIIHHSEDRYYTVRELAQLMCLPKDMKLPMESPGKIFQNVPANTAADWTEEVVKFCKGELELSSHAFLKQDNVSRRIETPVVPKVSVSLF